MGDAFNLIARASDPAMVLAANLRVVDWNTGAEALLGYAAAEVIGRPCGEVLKAILPHGEPLCGPGCSASDCFLHSNPFAARSCRAYHRDGRWVRISLSSLVLPAAATATEPTRPAVVLFLRPLAQAGAGQRAGQDGALRIMALGRFSLVAGDRCLPVEKWERKQSLSLLKCLVASRNAPVHRERLIECLWPDTDLVHGRGRLKVTVYFIRKQLRAAGLNADTLETVGESYALSRGAVWIDAAAFEALVDEGLALERARRDELALQCYEDARRVYRGDFLAEDPYADWCAEERERLREVHLDMLGRLADLLSQRRRFAEAAEICEAALASDPCRENFYRRLMECFAALGQRDRAIAQYRRCTAVLAKELGVGPTPETQRVYRRLVA